MSKDRPYIMSGSIDLKPPTILEIIEANVTNNRGYAKDNESKIRDSEVEQMVGMVFSIMNLEEGNVVDKKWFNRRIPLINKMDVNYSFWKSG